MISLQTLEERKQLASVYLDRVENQMALSKSDLRTLIQKYFARLIDRCRQYEDQGKNFHFGINKDFQKEVDSIMEDLQKEIFNIIYIRSIHASRIASERENENHNSKIVTAFLTSKILGSTLNDRIKEYTDKLKFEFEAYIAVSFVNRISKANIIRSYTQFASKPYKNQLIQDAFIQQGYKATRIASRGITFGNGKYTSSFNGLNMLEKDMIFKTYNHVLQHLWTKNDVTGWFSIRGGSLSCSWCDNMVGVFHPITEEYLGYHPNCLCLMIPVYSFDSKIT